MSKRSELGLKCENQWFVCKCLHSYLKREYSFSLFTYNKVSHINLINNLSRFRENYKNLHMVMDHLDNDDETSRYHKSSIPVSSNTLEICKINEFKSLLMSQNKWYYQVYNQVRKISNETGMLTCDTWRFDGHYQGDPLSYADFYNFPWI